MQFEWNASKGKENLRKHGVTFEEARGVFEDPDGILLDDPDHSDEEERFILLGLSQKPRLLVVCQSP